MKTHNKRSRKLMRVRNSNRINRLRNQHIIVLPLFVQPMFILVLIKLALEEQKTAGKMVERLLLHIDKINGNLNFPSTTPSTANLQLLVDDLSATNTAIEGGDLSRIPHRDTLMMQADNSIRLLSYDIQKQSGGDAEKIKSAGFETRKGKGASQPVDEVKKMRSKTFVGGKIKLLWGRLAYSRMNYVETSDNPAGGPWTPVGKTTRSSFVMDGLVPGRLYYFRVYGSNNLGDGPPSGPQEQRSM